MKKATFINDQGYYVSNETLVEFKKDEVVEVLITYCDHDDRMALVRKGDNYAPIAVLLYQIKLMQENDSITNAVIL